MDVVREGKPEIVRIEIKYILDEYPDLSWLGKFSERPEEGAINHRERERNPRVHKYFNPCNPEYAEQDYQRMMDYERQDWYMLGIKAIAEIRIPVGKTSVLVSVESSGIWGIESDAPEEYKEENADNELAELRKILLEEYCIEWNDELRIIR